VAAVPPTKYGPKEELSPSLGTPCAMCGVVFVIGDYTTLIRATHHSKYGNARLEVHWDCAMKSPD
jgi:hypothetical protein